jgi:NADH dehydrogenase
MNWPLFRTKDDTRGLEELNTDRKKVVIVGAGFAGLSAIETLHDKNFDVLLIDRHNFATFQPLLYQVATAGLNPGDVSFPIRTLLRKYPKVRFRQGELAKITPESNLIELEDGSRIGYDYLILAFGATSNYFGVKGAAEYSHAIYTLDDAIEVRNRIFHQFEKAAAHGISDGCLTFVVVGGGATGVEMAGASAELCDRALRTDYTSIPRSLVRVILVEQRSKVLEVFDEALSEYALEELRRRKVEVMLGSTVDEITPDKVHLKGGVEIPYGILIWAAGVGAPPLASTLGLPQGRGGRIVVNPDLRVADHENIFAVGDIAAATSGDELVPQLAQPALQEGRHAGLQIINLAQDLPTSAFSYKDRGIMATIGRRAAVAQLKGGIDLTGWLAWMAWLVLHLITLLGVRNKLSVLINWLWHYVSWGKGPRVILGG